MTEILGRVVACSLTTRLRERSSEELEHEFQQVVTVGQFFLSGLGRSFAVQALIGHEVIVAVSAAGHETPEAEIAFEAPEGSSGGFEVGPLTFEAIVVDEDFGIRLPADVADVEALGVVEQVVESAGVRPEAISDDISFSQRRRVFEGDVEGAASIFS